MSARLLAIAFAVVISLGACTKSEADASERLVLSQIAIAGSPPRVEHRVASDGGVTEEYVIAESFSMSDIGVPEGFERRDFAEGYGSIWNGPDSVNPDETCEIQAEVRDGAPAASSESRLVLTVLCL